MTALAALVLIVVSAALVYAIARYVRERDENRKVRALFSRYVPPQVVNDLLERDPRVLSAQECTATILSCRIRNFALFSEELSAEETLHALNEFHALAGAAIERERGIIESLRSDGVTGVFGVLIESPFQEERAIRAALTIVRLVSGLSDRWREQGRKPFAVTIGVHTGQVIAGDIGYQRRREFAVIGNPVQVALRLQQEAAELNASIVASSETFDAVRELFVGIPTSPLPLRGLKRLQQAYIVRGLARRDETELRISRQENLTHTVVTHEPPPESQPLQTEYIAPAPHDLFSKFDSPLPELPEIPPLSGVYEDGDGPPVQLPP